MFCLKFFIFLIPRRLDFNKNGAVTFDARTHRRSKYEAIVFTSASAYYNSIAFSKRCEL